tara:strand:- start:364 stop:678 length:315 start_codon:yes stop_codon:yes gene_type:complete
MNLKNLKLAIEQAQKVASTMDVCTNKFLLQDSINHMNQALTTQREMQTKEEIQAKIIDINSTIGLAKCIMDEKKTREEKLAYLMTMYGYESQVLILKWALTETP